MAKHIFTETRRFEAALVVEHNGEDIVLKSTSADFDAHGFATISYNNIQDLELATKFRRDIRDFDRKVTARIEEIEDEIQDGLAED